MKMMIWKELRENARWAVLGMICLLLGEIYALSTQRLSAYNGEGLTVGGSTFLLVSAFGCALIGAALGAVQILPEMRRDQWASLLHRPVSIGTIFLGKVVAGLALYLLATGVPLLVSIAYVAWPGAFAAPFVPGLAWPAVSDLMLGAAFYFGALLLALQRGGWFGTRGAIALAAVAVLALHLSGRWLFAVPMVAFPILLAAGWGAMFGPIRTRLWPSRIALALTTLVGLLTALLLVGAFLQWLPQKREQFSTYIDFRITDDGQIFIYKQQGNESKILTDTAGNAITDERYVGIGSHAQFVQTKPLAWERSVAAFSQQRRPTSRMELINEESDSAELWYLIRGSESYFVGYDRLSSRRIAICDASGFHAPDGPIRPFGTEPRSDAFNNARPYLFWVGTQLYAMDFEDRTMTALFDSASEAILGAVNLPHGRKSSGEVAVAVSSGIRIVDLTGTLLRTIPYARDPTRWPVLEIASVPTGSRTFLRYRPSYSQTANEERLTYLDEHDASGRLVRSEQLRLENFTPEQTRNSQVAQLLAPPIPAVAVTLWQKLRESSAAVIYRPFPGLDEGGHRRELLIFTGVSLVLGLVAFLWARRERLSPRRTVIWVLLAIVFGVAGLFAYRLASDWPKRVRCPRCTHRRPVSTGACPHCEGAWESQPPTGAEIFEPTLTTSA